MANKETLLYVFIEPHIDFTLYGIGNLSTIPKFTPSVSSTQYPLPALNELGFETLIVEPRNQ